MATRLITHSKEYVCDVWNGKDVLFEIFRMGTDFDFFT